MNPVFVRCAIFFWLLQLYREIRFRSVVKLSKTGLGDFSIFSMRDWNTYLSGHGCCFCCTRAATYTVSRSTVRKHAMKFMILVPVFL